MCAAGFGPPRAVAAFSPVRELPGTPGEGGGEVFAGLNLSGTKRAKRLLLPILPAGLNFG